MTASTQVTSEVTERREVALGRLLTWAPDEEEGPSVREAGDTEGTTACTSLPTSAWASLNLLLSPFNTSISLSILALSYSNSFQQDKVLFEFLTFSFLSMARSRKWRVTATFTVFSFYSKTSSHDVM